MTHHPLFDNQDILCEVFKHLPLYSDDWFDGTNYRTLAGSARVCKSFTDPALGVLWERCADLKLLFRILPSVVRVKLVDRPLHRLTVLGEGVLPEDFDRFQLYARYIRTVEHCAESSKLCPSVFQHLGYLNHGQPLFPGLTTLNWTQGSPSDTSLLTLAAPSILNLRLFLPDAPLFDDPECLFDEPELFMEPIPVLATELLLQNTFARAPFIQDLFISGQIHPSSLISISRLQHLRTVTLEYSIIDRDVFQILSMLENLDDLTGHITFYTEHPDIPQNAFPALRRLDISGSDVELQVALSSISSRQLRNLKINVLLLDEDFLAFPNTMETIRSSWPSLVDLRIHAELIGRVKEMSRADIRPLLGLHELDTFMLRVWHPLRLSDDNVYEMAAAWPSLRSLKIWTENGPASRNSPSFSAITELARRCGHLERLRLPFVLDLAQPPFGDEESGSVASCNLRHIDFRDALVELGASDPSGDWAAPKAKIMDGLFPNIDVDISGVEFEGDWEIDATLSKFLAAVREQRKGRT